jgi:hypothetical protein
MDHPYKRKLAGKAIDISMTVRKDQTELLP